MRPAIWSVLTAPFTGRTWRELAYLVIASMLAVASCIPAGVLLAPTAAMVMALIVLAADGTVSWGFSILLLPFVTLGVTPLVALVLMSARHVSAVVHRGLAGALVGERVPEPPAHPPPRRGFLGWLGWSLGDGAAWRALVFVPLSAAVTGIGAYISLLFGAVGLIAAGYPVWWSFTDPVNVGTDGVAHNSGMQFGDYYIETWPRALTVAAVGLIMLFAVPWVVRGFVWVDRLLVRNLLGPGRAAARVRDLEETRSQVVDDSAATLRRIERDLHDGTQARLVALAMQLDMAREQLTDDDQDAPDAQEAPDAQDAQEAAMQRARKLVETAHRNATEAITELREVTRSIHPPILDRGLDAALATLAAGSAVPTLLHTDIRTRPSAAIETIAYFCVAELLANVAKHSQARQATVVVATEDDRRLRIEVRDDGVGGARIGRSGSDRAGGGLAGLADRLRAVDGRLRIDSPAGGPTVVTADLPISS